MAAKDFSKVSGRRLRLALAVYDRKTHQFRASSSSALVTVANAREQARLWAAIEAAIGGEAWKEDEHSSRDTAAAPDPVEHLEA